MPAPGNDGAVIRRVREAGLIGLRGDMAKKLARSGGRRGLNEELLRTLFGLYLFASRTRRVVQMLNRLARGS